jgi:hypothetical protein
LLRVGRGREGDGNGEEEEEMNWRWMKQVERREFEGAVAPLQTFTIVEVVFDLLQVTRR